MKKILLATSILSGFAGMASAEITLSGNARMGLVNVAEFDAGDYLIRNVTQFNSRVRVAFSLSAETDSGLSFGGSFRADNAADAASGTAGSVYISGAFGKLSMGDVDTATAALVGQVDGVGYTGNGDWNELTYAGHSAEAALWTYSMGDLNVAASLGQQGVYESMDTFSYDKDDDSYSVAASYKLGNYTVSAGYESGNKAMPLFGYKYYEYSSSWSEYAVLNETTTVGFDAAFGDLTVKARAGSMSGGHYNGYREGMSGSQGALSVSYKLDAITVTGFYAESHMDLEGIDYAWHTERMGIGASYDLGGGATAALGYSDNNTTLYGPSYTYGDRRWDAGVNFSF